MEVVARLTQSLIDMSGQIVGDFQVLEYAAVKMKSGARWWVKCLRCKHEQIEKGNNLRRAQRGGFWLRCEGCGA